MPNVCPTYGGRYGYSDGITTVHTRYAFLFYDNFLLVATITAATERWWTFTIPSRTGLRACYRIHTARRWRAHARLRTRRGMVDFGGYRHRSMIALHSSPPPVGAHATSEYLAFGTAERLPGAVGTRSLPYLYSVP